MPDRRGTGASEPQSGVVAGRAIQPAGDRLASWPRTETGLLSIERKHLKRLALSDEPTVKPVPYTGVQFVAIPEFQGLGTTVGQLFSAALAGQMSVDDALKQAQDVATATMTEGGYIQ